MKHFRIIAALIAAFAVLPLMATTYYASPNGTGDGKSYNKPTTFAKGLKLLSNAGDTLYLFSGQYDLLTTDVNNLVGTASKRIVISGYEGINAEGRYDAILDFRKTEYGKRGLQIKNTCSYLHVKNLTLRYSGKNNLINYGSYNLFENLDIYGSADTGCQMKEGGNNVIKNVDSHDNFDYETMSGNTANFGGNADGFADKQHSGGPNHYIGCRAWNNSDDGWDFFQRVSSSNTIIENCVCFQNGPAYYNMKDHPRYETDKAWFDSKVGTQMTDRYGNTITITLEKYPCQGNGNGFKMGGQYTDHKILIHHCLAVGNNERGFDQNNNGGTMWVYNCSAYQNNVNFGFTTAFGTNYMRNNITLSSKNADQYKAQTIAANDHNSWNTGLTASSSDFQSLDTTQILAARKSDGSLAEGTFMRLKSSSKLIDAGIDVDLAYNGDAPDLGCYETAGEEHKPDTTDTVPTVQPEGTYAVAFVTILNSAEDKPLLKHLRANDSLWIVETDALDATIDYSSYDVLVLGSKPGSTAAGLLALKGYNKPMVLLKPWLLKSSAWNWGTAINTADLAVRVSQSEHPIFKGLTITNGELALFTQCETNAVTAISEWTNTEGVEVLASPVSQTLATTIAEFPKGTNCNGTVLPQPLVMIGVSEYSTLYLTDEAQKLVENAILYLLGSSIPSGMEDVSSSVMPRKYIQEGTLFIQWGTLLFDITGRRIR